MRGRAALTRFAGTRAGQRVLMGALARRFDPAGADGFEGELGFELRSDGGRVRAWTLVVGSSSARVRAGRGTPALTVRAGVADVVGVGAGELDPGSLLLEGRLDLEGDFALATRLGSMFRMPDPV